MDFSAGANSPKPRGYSPNFNLGNLLWSNYKLPPTVTNS